MTVTLDAVRAVSGERVTERSGFTITDRHVRHVPERNNAYGAFLGGTIQIIIDDDGTESITSTTVRCRSCIGRDLIVHCWCTHCSPSALPLCFNLDYSWRLPSRSQP